MPCFLLLFGAALLVLSPAASAAEFTTPKEVVAFYDSEADVGPTNLPIGPEAGSTTRSPNYLIRQIGPLNLDAGDCIDVRAREQFLNRNDANGWWTVNGIRSEHWWLWVGADIGINYTTGGPPTNADSGAIFRRNTGENWDWGIHRWTWDATEMRCFPTAMSSMYLFTHVEWYSSAGYRQSDSQYIINDQTGRLEVLHYGTP